MPSGHQESSSPSQHPSPESGETNQEPAKLSIVGIGASAGGLAALRTFFASIPPDCGLTFVVVLHLSPNHESIVAELLQGCTRMPVTQVQGSVAMAPNHVYVIPPGKGLIVTDSQLDLEDLQAPP